MSGFCPGRFGPALLENRLNLQPKTAMDNIRFLSKLEPTIREGLETYQNLPRQIRSRCYHIIEMAESYDPHRPLSARSEQLSFSGEGDLQFDHLLHRLIKIRKAFHTGDDTEEGFIDFINLTYRFLRILEERRTSARMAGPSFSDDKKMIQAAKRLLAREKNLEGQEKRIEDQLGKLDYLNEQANLGLQEIKKVGMAGAFSDMHKKLNGASSLWIFSFLLTIMGMVWLGFELRLHQTEDLWAGFRRLPFFAPLTWFGWVCIRNYGFASRIQQDYAFKLSSAQAFDGYKKEALELDEELAKKLMDNAIDVFSNNPLRFYTGQKNHASPVHEVLDLALDRCKKVVVDVKSGKVEVDTRPEAECSDRKGKQKPEYKDLED